MDDKIPSTLKRPWNTPGRILGWFVLLMVSAFAVICGTALLSDGHLRSSDLIRYGVPVSFALAIAALFAFWFFRWVRSWRNFRRFLFVAACLVTLILLAYAEENWRGKRAWEQHRQYWEAQGEKFNLAAFVPPQVPEDKNFALAPLLRPLSQFAPEGRRVLDTNALAQIDRISAQLSGGPGRRENLDLGNLTK